MSLVISFYIIVIGLIYLFSKKKEDKDADNRIKENKDKMVRKNEKFCKTICDGEQVITRDIEYDVGLYLAGNPRYINDNCANKDKTYIRLNKEKLDRYYIIANDIETEMNHSGYSSSISSGGIPFNKLLTEISLIMEYSLIPYNRYINGYCNMEICIALFAYRNLKKVGYDLYIKQYKSKDISNKHICSCYFEDSIDYYLNLEKNNSNYNIIIIRKPAYDSRTY